MNPDRRSAAGMSPGPRNTSATTPGPWRPSGALWRPLARRFRVRLDQPEDRYDPAAADRGEVPGLHGVIYQDGARSRLTAWVADDATARRLVGLGLPTLQPGDGPGEFSLQPADLEAVAAVIQAGRAPQ